MKNHISIGLAVTALALLPSILLASNINGVNGGMPNRISMNVTVPKQTQGATFGEKVNAGLQAAGRHAGNTEAVIVECGRLACAFAFPGGDGYRADLQTLALAPLGAGQAAGLRSGAIGQGASLVGAVMPGAGIVSAAVSSVGNLAGGGGRAAAASYAATGRVANVPTTLASRSEKPGMIDVIDPLVDGEYLLTVVVEKATSGLKDTLKTNVRASVTQQVRIEIGFSIEAGVLKTRHDTTKNSIGNIR